MAIITSLKALEGAYPVKLSQKNASNGYLRIREN